LKEELNYLKGAMDELKRLMAVIVEVFVEVGDKLFDKFVVVCLRLWCCYGR